MTTEELRKAAERCRRELVDSWADVPVKGPTYTELLAVLDDYLTEHPSDDSEPLTAERLTAMGGLLQFGSGWHFGDGDDVGVNLSYWDNREGGDVYRLKTGGQLPRVELTNVGELRRLLSVFGIPPKG